MGARHHRSARVTAGFSLCIAAIALTDGSVAAGPGPSMTATPASGLVDGQWITVTGSGFDDLNPALPGSQLTENFLCRADAVDESGCDADNAFDFDIQLDGTFTFDFPVDASIYTPSGPFDCRRAASSCKIGVGLLDDLGSSVFVTIDFDPAAPLRPPVSATVTPSTDLRDGQTVAVHGEGLFPQFDTLTVQCARAADVPSGCDFDNAIRLVPPEPDGSIDRLYTVRSRFVAGTGEDVDCVAADETCVILVSVGATRSPDRLATVPLHFSSADSPGPAPAPAPQPPQGPVTGLPSFTG